MVDEAEALKRDRRLYHLHARTLLVGAAGWALTIAFGALLQPWSAAVLLIGFSAMLALSGVLAVKVGRTMFSKRPTDHLGMADPYEDHGDALPVVDLFPAVDRAAGPWLILVLGLGLLALSTSWLW